MSLTTSDTTRAVGATPRVVMRGVGWAGYSLVRRARGERSRPKLVYLDGDVHLVSPAFRHERMAGRLARLVTVLVEELNIPCTPAGSTTFRRRSKRGGAEADASFYLANARLVQGKEALHLRHDPPPDLVVEAVNNHDAVPSVEVWRRFGVPEVWVCDGLTMRILVLGPDGRYAESPTGPAFPTLTASEILERVNAVLGDGETETDWLRRARTWARDVVKPRAEGGA